MEDTRPGILNIDLIQNENYEEVLELTDDITDEPFDISSASDIILEVREDLRYQTVFKLSLNNGITITDTNKIKILIHNSLTRKLSRKRYVYDILFNLESGAQPAYLIKGQILVTNTISRIQ